MESRLCTEELAQCPAFPRQGTFRDAVVVIKGDNHSVFHNGRKISENDRRRAVHITIDVGECYIVRQSMHPNAPFGKRGLVKTWYHFAS